MKIKLAFAGFRHPHIMGLYKLASGSGDIEITAACEEDGEARKEASTEGIDITHDDIKTMLSQAGCDAVAVGDYYGGRGTMTTEALSRGKHVISDKPLCTTIEELDRIEELSSSRGLKVGCMFDLRDSAPFIGARDLVRQGTIGEVHAISFGGQHPLRLGTRPGWYFEPGKHGGTINDIAIHAIDLIPWITGLEFATVNAARCWNAFALEYPHFKDAAQVMLTMTNGCGVLGDVSYFMPDGAGYSLPMYWRMTFFGRGGIIETSATAEKIMVATAKASSPEELPVPAAAPGGYLKSFMDDIAGSTGDDALTTESVLRAARVALMAQHAADAGLHEVGL